MKRCWVAGAWVLLLLSCACVKEKDVCGCDAPTLRMVTDQQGSLYYDSTHRQLVILGGPAPGTMYFVCSFNAQADSAFQQLTLPKHVAFSGTAKPTCTPGVITTGEGAVDIALTALSAR